MSITIKQYDGIYEAALFEMMRLEKPEWDSYCGDAAAKAKYKKALESCVVFIILESDILCGYIRAVDDFGYGIYIYDLLVHKNYRGKGYGKRLIEKVLEAFEGTVYVMSDVNEYYFKQGYTNIAGSVIIIRE